MRRKKQILGLIALLANLIAKAYTWIIISLVIIAVGTVIVIKLLQCIKHLWPNDPPPPGQTTNVVVVMTNSAIIYDNSNRGPAPNVVLLQPINSPVGFVFQYAFDSEVWMAPGTNLVGIIGPVTQTPSNYTFTIFASGQAIQLTSDSNSPAGFDSQVLDEDDQTYHPVIERSNDLRAWAPISTNFGCLKYDIQTFTDTNAPSQAFYRVRWQ